MLLKDVLGRRLTICGTDNLSTKLALSMIEQGARVTLTGAGHNRLEAFAVSLKQMALSAGYPEIETDSVEAARAAEVIVSFSREENLINRAMVEVMTQRGIVFDGGIGCVSSEAITYCNEHGIKVIRPDMRAVLACELASTLGTDRTVRELMGRTEIAGIPVVAGGLVGKYGDIVVDSVSNPSRVVGVADGKGMVIYEVPDSFSESLHKVEKIVLYKQAFPDIVVRES